MGKNARIRKERKIIEKYGELPMSPQPFPWLRLLIGLVILVVIGYGGYYASAKMKKASPTAKSTPSVQPTATTTPSQETKNMTATISTTMGDIKLELYPKDAPKTVANFKGLADKGYYNGVIFHRVIKDFMIQGGDPTGTGRGGESIYGARFDDEINSHKIVEGTLAMANAGPNTNGSQFFIMASKKDYSSLDGHYTVFGKVTEGLDNVYKISQVETDANDKPKTDVKINKVTIEEK